MCVTELAKHDATVRNHSERADGNWRQIGKYPLADLNYRFWTENPASWATRRRGQLAIGLRNLRAALVGGRARGTTQDPPVAFLGS